MVLTDSASFAPSTPDETSPLLQKPDVEAEASSNQNSASISKHRDEEAQRDQDEIGDGAKLALRKQVIWITPALAIGIFLSALDQTIVASAYGTIGSDLHALNNTSWVATAYFLTFASFQPLYGKMSDIFGRKLMLLFTYAEFGIGCLLCGVARNLTELVIARGLTGIGGGGLITVVAILLSDVATLRERGVWQGYLNIIFATGAAFGACIGGLLADCIGWRWIFLLQVPMAFIAFAAVFFMLKLPHENSSNWTVKTKRVDFLGSLVLVSAVFALLFGLDSGSNYSWTSAVAIGCPLVSFILFVIFFAIEAKLASEPITPVHVVFRPTLVASYLSNFFSHAAILGSIYYIPLYFQAVRGLSATQAGLRVLPVTITSMFGALIAGYVMQRTGRYYWLNLNGYIILVLGLLLLLLFTGLASTSMYGVWFGLIFIGYSEGSTIVSTLIAQIANANIDEQSVVIACSYLFRTLGSVVGISFSASCIQLSLRMDLHNSLHNSADTDSIIKHVRESLDYINTLDPNIMEAVRKCYGSAIRATFILQLCFAVLSLCSSWFFQDKRLT